MRKRILNPFAMLLFGLPNVLGNKIAFCLIAFFTGIIVLPATGWVGLALIFAGKYLWKLTRKYITWIVSMKRNMLGH